MIYVCNICGEFINDLNTPGDEVNKLFTCPSCSKDIQGLLKEAKKIQLSLLALFGKSR